MPAVTGEDLFAIDLYFDLAPATTCGLRPGQGNVVEIYAARHLRWLETRTPTWQVRDSRVGSASWSTARVRWRLV